MYMSILPLCRYVHQVLAKYLFILEEDAAFPGIVVTDGWVLGFQLRFPIRA